MTKQELLKAIFDTNKMATSDVTKYVQKHKKDFRISKSVDLDMVDAILSLDASDEILLFNTGYAKAIQENSNIVNTVSQIGSPEKDCLNIFCLELDGKPVGIFAEFPETVELDFSDDEQWTNFFEDQEEDDLPYGEGGVL